jgi:hypothetical protein
VNLPPVELGTLALAAWLTMFALRLRHYDALPRGAYATAGRRR